MVKPFKNSFLILALGIFILMGLIIYGLSWMTYQALLDESRMELQAEAYRIEHAVSAYLDEAQSLMAYTGKRVANDQVDDPKQIWGHLKEVLGRKEFYQKSSYWPDFYWLTDQNLQTVDSLFGVLATPVDLSIRKYTQIVRQKPWVLVLDPPDFGRPSHKWLVPGGLGVEDENGKFLGIVGVGFEISELTKHIDKILANPAVEFAIFNSNLSPVLHSSSKAEFQLFQTFLQTIVETMLKTNNEHGIALEEKIPQIGELYATNVTGYPWTIITFLKKSSINQQWRKVFVPHILEVVGIGISCLIILFFFWRFIRKKNQELDDTKQKLEHAFSLAKASDAAKEQFLRSANNELLKPINAIIKNVDLLGKNLKRQMDTELVWEKQLALLDEILNNALDFKNLTNNAVKFSEIEIESIINECVVILSKQAFDKAISLDVVFAEKVPRLLGDELKIKQIFVGLLSRAIKLSPRNEKIHILVAPHFKDGLSSVQITIQDWGFSLSDERMSRLHENLGHVEDKIDHMDMEFSAIEHLIDLHKGKCFIDNQSGKGTVVTVFLPLHKELPPTMKN